MIMLEESTLASSRLSQNWLNTVIQYDILSK